MLSHLPGNLQISSLTYFGCSTVCLQWKNCIEFPVVGASRDDLYGTDFFFISLVKSANDLFWFVVYMAANLFSYLNVREWR